MTMRKRASQREEKGKAKLVIVSNVDNEYHSKDILALGSVEEQESQSKHE